MFGLVSSLMRPAGLIRQGPVWLVTLGLLVALAACSMAAPAAETGLGSADASGTEAARLDAEEPEDVVNGDEAADGEFKPDGDGCHGVAGGADIAAVRVGRCHRNTCADAGYRHSNVGSRSRRRAGQTNR